MQNTSIYLKTDNFAFLVITRCAKNSIKIAILCIVRNNDAAADAISRLTDYGDLQTTVDSQMF